MQRCDAILYAMSEKLKPEADKRAIAMPGDLSKQMQMCIDLPCLSLS